MVTLGAADSALNLRIVFFASPEVAQKSTKGAQNKHSKSPSSALLPVVKEVKACSRNFFWVSLAVCLFLRAFENCL